VESVVTVPAPLACGISTVFELLDSLLKQWLRALEKAEFDDGGTTVVHCVSHVAWWVFIYLRVSQLSSCGFDVVHVGFLHGVKPRGIRLARL
jgi:hypothetical protein